MRKINPIILSLTAVIILFGLMANMVQAKESSNLLPAPDHYVNQANNGGLVAHWSMDDIYGTHIYDISGNNHHAIKNNAVVGSNGIPASPNRINYRSIDLRGGNYYADADAFDIANDFSIAMWVYVNNTTANQAIIGKHTSSGINQLLIGIYSGNYSVTIHGNSHTVGTPTLGWQHLLVTGRKITTNQTRVTLYRDGIMLWQQDFTTEVGDISGGKGWTIGQDWDGSTRTDYFNGMIDDIRIYNQELLGLETVRLALGYGCFNDGASWTYAFEDLNCALTLANAGDEIWVAGGIYKHSTNRGTHFILDKELYLYGGFAGTETALSQRDITANPTTLSGDIKGDDVGNSNKGENSQRILALTANAPQIVDGFTIYGGQTATSGKGAGIYNGGTITHTLANSIVEYNDSSQEAGGVLNAGIFQVMSSTIQHNSAGYEGAGIYNSSGTLYLSGSTIQHNSSQDRGAGIYNNNILHITHSTIAENDAAGANARSGGIHNSEIATISYSDILSNTANADGGGISNVGATLTLDHVNVAGNDADGTGGGIYNSGILTMTNSAIQHNSSFYEGGGLLNYNTALLDNTIVQNNSAIYSGGGIFNSAVGFGNSAGILTVTHSTIAENATLGFFNYFVKGGGIGNDSGTVTIAYTDILSNSSGNGGAGIGNASGTLNLDFVTIRANHAYEHGGGIYSYGGGTQIINSSTIISNSADIDGGGLLMDSYMNMDSTSVISNTSGGVAGIYFAQYNNVNATIHNSTIGLNDSTSTATGGIHFGPGTFTLSSSTIVHNDNAQIEAALGATVTMDHTILDGTIAGFGYSCTNNGTINDSGYNLAFGATACNLTAPTTIDDLSQMSTQLEENTPYPPTFIVYEFSPAIDNGNPTCTGVDQRGVTRPQGLMHNGELVPTASCDIGATEMLQSVLEGQYEPYARYKDWADTTLLNPTHQFRINEITKPSISATTTITDIHLSFEDFTEGRLLYRYCADYDTIQPGIDCRNWDDLTPAEKTARVGTWQTFPLETPLDLHNKLVQANDIYRFVYNAPQPFHWIFLEDSAGWCPTPTVECAQNYPYYFALTLNIMTITDTLESTYEMAVIPMVYGNEFMVDGLHHNLGYTGQSGVDILNDEIALLEKAEQQFAISAQIWLDAMRYDFGDGVLLGDYFEDIHYESFAIASERQVTAILEIAERRRLRGDAPAEILTMLAGAYSNQYFQALTLAKLFENAGNPLDPFTTNGGRQLMNNIDRLNQMRDSLLVTANPLGYDDKYVPRASFVDLRDDMGEIGNCVNGVVSGTNTGILGDLFEKECSARFAQREFDENGANANSFTGELAQLKSTYETELDQVCGSDRTGDNVCDGTGLLALNFDDLEAAHKRVSLAWQRAQAIPQQISIEQQRSGQVIRLINGAALDINAHQLAIAKLEGYQEVRTVASTTEIWEEGSDPNDPESGAYWLDFGIDAGNCLLSGLTLGALGDGCQGNNENLENNIAALAGIETEPSAIETVDKTWNPQAEEIAEIEGMKEMRAMELEADIVGANSEAVIRNLLLEQADLLIEYEIAIDELNRVITERNMLTQQYRNALNNRARVDVDYAQYIFNPAWRIIRDNSALQATQEHEKATHSVYLLIKAMEYVLLDEPMGVIPAGNLFGQNLYTALYQARTAEHLEEIVEELDAINISLSGSATYLRQISLAEDVLGLTDDNLSELLPYTPDPTAPNWSSDPACNTTITTTAQLRTCFFRQYLSSRIVNDPDLTGGNESVLFVFGTSIELINPENYLWNSRIAPVSTIGEDPCSVSDPCAGIRFNIVTNQTWSSGAPLIQLTHDGQATYRRQFGPGLFDTEITEYSPGPTTMVGQPIPAGFPSGSRVTRVVQSDVNGTGGQADGGFANLSSAVTAWQFMMDIENGNGANLDLDKINDILLEIDTIAYPIQNNSLAGRLAEMWVEMLNAENAGKLPSPSLQAEYATLLDSFNASIELERKQKPRSETKSSRQVIIPPSMFGGDYAGNVNIASPAPLAIVDAGLTFTETGGTLTGNLCISCTLHYGSSASVTGVYTDSGTPVDSFIAQTAPFTQTVNEHVVTRTIHLDGEVVNYGDVISGTYTELITGYPITDTLVTGHFIMIRHPLGACTDGRPSLVGYEIDLSSGHASLSWADDSANVGGYEVYRSDVPYFELNAGSYLTSLPVGSSSWTDSGNAGINYYYRVRAVGCNSSNIKTSKETGIFTFNIVPGS